MKMLKANSLRGKGGMLSPENFKWLLLGAIILITVDVLFFNNVLELRAEEPRRAVVSFEMLKSGEWIVPHIHSEVYYNKPPAFNWVQAAFMSVFGYSEWVARLPGAISFLLTGVLVYAVMKRIVSENLGIFGAFAFLTSADLLFYGSVNAGEIDLFYALLTCVQFFVIYKYMHKDQLLKLFLISYLITSVGFLTKGIPSLAFQAFSLLAYFTISKKFWKLFSWQHIAGILLLVVVVGGYLLLYNESADAIGFLGRQFKETSQRSANEFSALAIVVTILNFPVLLFTKMMPWTLLFPLYFYKPVRQFVWNNPVLKFVVVIFFANILIYWTAPDVRARYIYMFFPLVIILLVAPLSVLKWEDTKFRRFLTIPGGVGIVLIGIGMFVLLFLLDLNGLQIGVAVFLGITSLSLGYVYWRDLKTVNVLWLIVFSMLLGRLGYNSLVLPHQEKFDDELVYRSIVNEMCVKANGKEIILTGPHEMIPSGVSFFGVAYYNSALVIPPTVPYQLPYYYAKYTNNVLKYIGDPSNANYCYLQYKIEDIDYSKIKVLMEFEAKNDGRIFVLYLLNM